ncbi:dimethylsulfonioproprionate lyase family protein [Alisedimentitalea sp. MJ-SS2]|uniref:dimethylsulfonioproprionate lyase family protein n=1 Tax=Aliisedimentitalea sp. MJ-SS2 TaxID=3049795 RepID=UPI00290BA45F|nr:dimethylsulfonioproprionate lyase family protein [Alisedimentitalea sp. MJ-SS2]MDU8927221.1 dimethylsulfonioproprionate lyase family protein [Alisedimentitalea sp. MJ-SS2]
MTPDDALATLLLATRNLVSTRPEIADFVGDRLEHLGYTRPDPRDLPITDRLMDLMPQAGPDTTELTFAVLAAAPHLEWQQSYDQDQVGADFLNGYGWFNLVSPDGPYSTDSLRISVGYWEQNLTYPPHRHAAEELYCTLAGSARFETEGRDPLIATPGTLIHHSSNQLHSFSMPDAPLLAMAFWRGDNLTAPSLLDTTP